jgi:hypothetical protein
MGYVPGDDRQDIEVEIAALLDQSVDRRNIKPWLDIVMGRIKKAVINAARPSDLRFKGLHGVTWAIKAATFAFLPERFLALFSLITRRERFLAPFSLTIRPLLLIPIRILARPAIWPRH